MTLTVGLNPASKMPDTNLWIPSDFFAAIDNQFITIYIMGLFSV